MLTPGETTASPSTNGALIDRVQQLRLDNQLGRGPGTTRGSWLPWVLCGLMAVAWVGVGVRYLQRPTPTSEIGAGAAGGANAGATGATQAAGGPAVAPGELVLQLKGTVTPALQVNLSPNDVSGVLEEIYFKEGDRVKTGKLLGKIQDQRYKNDKNGAEAAQKAAKARAVRADLALASAKYKLIRAQEVEIRTISDLNRAERSRSTTSDQDYVKAVADKKVASAEMEMAKADLEAAKSDKEAAEFDLANAQSRYDETDRLLANCRICAPIDGTILTKVADKGALVSPLSFNVSASVCAIADLAKQEVEIDVPERQITRIKPGMDCLVQADADPAHGYRGVVDRVMPIADDTKNVVKVRVRVYLKKDEEPGAFLKPKMSATATIYNRPFKLDPAIDQSWGDEK